MLVPSKGAERRAGELGQRRREDLAARRRDVGLEPVPERGGPAEEKLVTTPDLPVFAPSGLKLKRTLARPPTEARKSRR